MDVIAHRGLTAAAPENSLSAIEHALRRGLTTIEVDVRAAGDGRLFLLHDPSLDRTTNGAGRLQRLSGSQAAALRLADGTHLPSLEDAVDLVRGRGVLCLDVKEPHLASSLRRSLRGFEAHVEVWSTHELIVRGFSSAGFATALISGGLLPRGIGEFLWTARDAGARAVSFYPADVEPHVAAACRNAAIALLCGTPNDIPTWRFLKSHGARGVITDRPIECRSAFSRATAPAL